jgi:hypothetical protein
MTRTSCTLALGCLVLLTVSLRAELIATQPTPLPPLNMEDQYERLRQLAGYRGHVVVMIYGDRASANANKQLGETLHVHFHPGARNLAPEKALEAPVLPLEGVPPETHVPDVVALPIACVGKAPALVRGFIRGQIRNGSPYMPVWLDFEDQMKTRFGLAASVPNIAIADAQGRLRYVSNGVPNQEEITRMIQAITALRYEAIQGK